jgi:hypothetical protein
MVPFVVFTFLSINDIGVYVSSYTIVYFALRFVLNPRLKLKVDVLGLVLLAAFVSFLFPHMSALL